MTTEQKLMEIEENLCNVINEYIETCDIDDLVEHAKLITKSCKMQECAMCCDLRALISEYEYQQTCE